MSLIYLVASSPEDEMMSYARAGDIEKIKNMEKTGAFNNYLLIYCAEIGQLEIVKYLISKCEDKHVYNEALKRAASTGHIEVVKYLVTSGADAYEQALIHAASSGHIELIKFFIVTLGTNIHVLNECALTIAAHNVHIETVKYLISQGADINNAINHCKSIKAKYILKQFIEKEMYKGPINEKTELDCGICLIEMNTENQEIVQCNTCKKCVHHECNIKWTGTCVYCRN
jgi:hypothetical protein